MQINHWGLNWILNKLSLIEEKKINKNKNFLHACLLNSTDRGDEGLETAWTTQQVWQQVVQVRLANLKRSCFLRILSNLQIGGHFTEHFFPGNAVCASSPAGSAVKSAQSSCRKLSNWSQMTL